MPQTISLQRGQVSLSSSTSSLVFTNSASGISTRLIPGYIMMRMNSADTGITCTFGVLRNGAAVGNEAVFAIANSQGGFNSTDGFSFSPHDAALNVSYAGGTSTSQFVKAIYDGGLLCNSMYFGTSNNAYQAYYNNDVMIGPSDAIYAYFRSNAGTRTATVQYCFTLITES